MGTILIAALLSLVFVYAIYSYVRKLRQGGGCCGGHEPAEKKVKVADRDKRHYPYTVTLTVDGMTCGNCVRRVENALNRLDGVWAEVDLGARGRPCAPNSARTRRLCVRRCAARVIWCSQWNKRIEPWAPNRVRARFGIHSTGTPSTGAQKQPSWEVKKGYRTNLPDWTMQFEGNLEEVIVALC